MLHRHQKQTHRRIFSHHGLISLADLQPGEQALVSEMHGGHALVSRLTGMGFTPGVEVSLIQNAGVGPLIARVREARIAIGRMEARRVLVKLQGSHGS